MAELAGAGAPLAPASFESFKSRQGALPRGSAVPRRARNSLGEAQTPLNPVSEDTHCRVYILGLS